MLAKHALSQLSYGPIFAAWSPHDACDAALKALIDGRCKAAHDQNRAVIF
jgi:hypothetical protein